MKYDDTVFFFFGCQDDTIVSLEDGTLAPTRRWESVGRESESTNQGRGAYDTTGTPKPTPPPPK